MTYLRHTQVNSRWPRQCAVRLQRYVEKVAAQLSFRWLLCYLHRRAGKVLGMWLRAAGDAFMLGVHRSSPLLQVGFTISVEIMYIFLILH